MNAKKIFRLVLVLIVFGFFNAISEAVLAKPWKNLTVDEVFSSFPERLLAQAALKADEAAIKKLIASGVDVNARGQHALTALDLAIFRGNRKGVLALLKVGANPNLYSDDGGAPIHSACYLQEDPYFLQQILLHGGNPNLMRILEKSPNVVGTYPLHMVMLGNNNAFEKAKLLIDAGADLSKKDNLGFIPIENAVSSRQYDLILWMFKDEARFQLISKYSELLVKSVKQDMTNRVSYLFERKQIAQREEVVQVLKKNGSWK